MLENLIVKIQNTFERPISLVKSIREKAKHAPDEPKTVRVKIEGTDEEMGDKVFLQSTKDIQYTQEYNTWQKVNGYCRGLDKSLWPDIWNVLHFGDEGGY